MKFERAGKATEAFVRIAFGCLFFGLGMLPAQGILHRPDVWPIVVPFAGCFMLAGLWLAVLGRVFRGMSENRMFFALLVLAFGGALLGALFPAAGVATFAGLFVVAWRLSRRTATAELEALASLPGLRLRRAGWRQPPSAFGTVDDFDVLVEETDLGTTATVRNGLPSALSFFASSILRGGRIGDAAFDGTVSASGAAETVLRAFDPETRAAAIEAVGRGVEMRNGVIRWFSREPKVVAPVGAMLLVAHALRASNRTLEAAASADPVPGVRARALDLLAAHPLEERAGPLRAALADESHHVRTHAAKLILADPDSPDRARAEAVLREIALAQGGLSVSAEDAGKLTIAQQAGAVSISKKP